MAKAEAVKENLSVYIDFDFLPVATNGDGNIDDGYTVWSDNDGDGTYTGGTDVIIGTPVSSLSLTGIEIYDGTATGGPAANDGPGAAVIGDGVTVSNDRFRFRPNGMTDKGEVYFYFPAGGTVSSGPWAVMVNNVGRIKISEWSPEWGWRPDNND